MLYYYLLLSCYIFILLFNIEIFQEKINIRRIIRAIRIFIYFICMEFINNNIIIILFSNYTIFIFIAFIK